MGKCKHYILVLFCGMLMSPQTTYAFWPVFDFTEFPSIYKDVEAGRKTVKDLIGQLEANKGRLDAIGKEMNSFVVFGKGLKKRVESVADAANKVVETTKKSEDETKQATSETSTATDTTVNTQKDLVGDYVDQTQTVLENEKSQKTSFNLETQSFKISENTINPLPFEEEEEEEEADTSAIEGEINALQKTALSEQKQLATELNDILDSQLTILNKSATENESVLEELSATIWRMKKISQENKERLQKKIAQISQKQKQTGDWAIRIVESVKENYNKEYNNKIKDGMNNYTKVVTAYIRGDTTRENVINAGEILKKSVNAINVTPDAGVLNELNKKMADIRSEVENLAAEIKEVIENT